MFNGAVLGQSFVGARVKTSSEWALTVNCFLIPLSIKIMWLSGRPNNYKIVDMLDHTSLN